MSMPTPTSPFWTDYIPLLMAAWVLVFLVILVCQYFRFKRKGNPFSEVDPGQTLFDEQGASGYSSKSWLTKLGGARRILWVTVTITEVWIRPRPFLLSRVFGADLFDLIHRISKGQIVSLGNESSPAENRVALGYAHPEGKTRYFYLCLKCPHDFMRAVRKAEETL